MRCEMKCLKNKAFIYFKIFAFYGAGNVDHFNTIFI